MVMRSNKGFFKPKYPEKYLGDSKNIVYRSQIEFKFMMYLDHSSDIVQWASEEITIPYYDPSSRKVRRYFPDFVIKTKAEKTVIVEIKCTAETHEPILTEGKTKRRYLKEMLTWATNQAKWTTASQFAKERGWSFKIITERDLGMKY